MERWKHSSIVGHVDVIDPTHTQKNESTVSWHNNLASLPADYVPHIIVFAVKPQQLDTILPEYHVRFASINPLYLSIAAGKTLAYFQKHLGGHAHIVRAMPNTPALVGQGMTVLCASETLPASARKIAGDLMGAVGKIEWLADESLMDAVTAISGCGPAYVFLFLESLVKAAVESGLPEPLAKTLALQTLSGSVALAGHSAKNFEQLRIDVTSPGGATEAALSLLMRGDALTKLFESAVLAAINRSKELA